MNAVKCGSEMLTNKHIVLFTYILSLALSRFVEISQKMNGREKAIITMRVLKTVFLLLFITVFISSFRWLNFELTQCRKLPARYSLEKY